MHRQYKCTPRYNNNDYHICERSCIGVLVVLVLLVLLPGLRRPQAQAAKRVSVARLSVTGGGMLLRLKPKKAVPPVPELALGHLTS